MPGGFTHHRSLYRDRLRQSQGPSHLGEGPDPSPPKGVQGCGHPDGDQGPNHPERGQEVLERLHGHLREGLGQSHLESARDQGQNHLERDRSRQGGDQDRGHLGKGLDRRLLKGNQDHDRLRKGQDLGQGLLERDHRLLGGNHAHPEGSQQGKDPRLHRGDSHGRPGVDSRPHISDALVPLHQDHDRPGTSRLALVDPQESTIPHGGAPGALGGHLDGDQGLVVLDGGANPPSVGGPGRQEGGPGRPGGGLGVQGTDRLGIDRRGLGRGRTGSREAFLREQRRKRSLSQRRKSTLYGVNLFPCVCVHVRHVCAQRVCVYMCV